MPHKMFNESWPQENLDDALVSLAKFSRLKPQLDSFNLSHIPKNRPISEVLSDLGRAVDLDIQPTQLRYGALKEQIPKCGPALLALSFPEEKETRYLAILHGRAGKVRYLSPELTTNTCSLKTLRPLLVHQVEQEHLPGIEQVLDVTGINPRRKERLRLALLEEKLSSTLLDLCWTVALPADRPLYQQAKNLGLPAKFLNLALLFVFENILLILSWYLIGRGVLQGKVDEGWLWPWGFVILIFNVSKTLSFRLQGFLSIELGTLIKRKLLARTFHVKLSQIQHQGMGELLGRIFDVETIQDLALNGGFTTLFALINIGFSAWVLAHGEGSAALLSLLGVYVLFMLFMCLGYYKKRKTWTQIRLKMTHDLIEKMVGHRTRLAQEKKGDWHLGEDSTLSDYLHCSKTLDRSQLSIEALFSNGWLLIGVLGLTPYLIRGTASSGTMAVSLGGILLATIGIHGLSHGLSSLSGFFISLKNLQPILELSETRTKPAPGSINNAHFKDLTIRNLSFSYRKEGEPVLEVPFLDIRNGDQILLTGESGGGKSTFVHLVSGTFQPDEGLLLLNGLDVATTGSLYWRKSIALAPQFHENFVFSGSFAYNLLMGAQWPPTHEGLQEAYDICVELGLGPLLEKMPSGMFQMVGETGWQLSHGERSRLFIARALHQKAKVLILDESFAALDQENLEKVFECVLKRSKTLILVAHP